MGPTVDFARVLDETLEDARRAAAARPAVPLPGGFWMRNPGLGFELAGGTVPPVRHLHRFHLAGGPRLGSVVRPRPPGAPRLVRIGSAEQREAAEVFERLGGPRLGPVVFEDALRRAYRVLARRWHPDAHPACRPDERRRLTSAFAELTAAYRRLMAGIES